MRRKLTEKLKQEIKLNPYRLRQSDFEGDALTYLHRIRGARKAVKTKAEKIKYKTPRKKREKAPAQISDFIEIAAKAKGMSVKKYREKYKKEIANFETTGRLFYNREIDLLKLDIKFLPKGRGVYVNGRRVNRIRADYYLTRLKNKILSTGLTYERVNIEHFYDGRGNIHVNLPTPSMFLNIDDDPEAILDFIQDSYAITFYRR